MNYIFYFQATVAKIALKSWSLYLIGSAFLLRTRWVVLFAPVAFNELYVLFSSHSSKNHSKI
ncbi:hypothetical protein [Campylobacter sp.]|uniref:hypothetical protein n=1 Tax=Campylobacter sp. TaxID=205 RepID=UPI002A75F467|nr:hypothetical protein [Campylobacter sp.]MDY2763491.1 hypothetical protein [Campylobacter sp.]